MATKKYIPVITNDIASDMLAAQRFVNQLSKNAVNTFEKMRIIIRSNIAILGKLRKTGEDVSTLRYYEFIILFLKEKHLQNIRKYESYAEASKNQEIY